METRLHNVNWLSQMLASAPNSLQPATPAVQRAVFSTCIQRLCPPPVNIVHQAVAIPKAEGFTAAAAGVSLKPGSGSQEEAKDAFKELLASVNAASDWTWEHAMRLIISDAR